MLNLKSLKSRCACVRVCVHKSASKCSITNSKPKVDVCTSGNFAYSTRPDPEVYLKMLYFYPTGSRRSFIFALILYTGCHRRNVEYFGRVFLMLNYTDITQNTYTQSWTVTEIMAREVWNCYTLIDYQIHIETGRNMWFM